MTHRDPVPSEVSTIAEALAFRAAELPDVPFVRAGGSGWVTASELDARASVVVAGLQRLGVGVGDRVATILPNRIEAIEVFFALAKIGAVQAPMNYWLKGEFLRHQLVDCEPRVVVADSAGVEVSSSLLSETSTETVVTVEDVEVPGPLRAVRYEELAAEDVIEDAEAAGDPSTLFSILYTSGTTGMPKGCMLSSGYYVNIGRIYGEREWVVPGDRIHTAFPFFHTSGQMHTLMSSVMNGASASYDEEFHASTFMSTAASLDATVLFGVGFMASAILAQPPSPSDGEPGFRLASWIPLTVDQQLEFEDRFDTPVVCEGYGQTEVLPVSISSVDGPRRRDGAGEIHPSMEVRIVDDADVDVPDGEPGEVVVRPRFPHRMFQGYWRNSEATVDAWRGLWHHTGDTAIRDSDGFLVFVDRKKDAVRRRGENVSSFQLELAIGEHPSVEAVAVVAVPSTLGEDEIKASLVLAGDATLTAEEIFEFFRTQLPYFAIPRYVDIRDALPVNSVGRVMKQALRDEGVPDHAIDLEELDLTVPRDERRRLRRS